MLYVNYMKEFRQKLKALKLKASVYNLLFFLASLRIYASHLIEFLMMLLSKKAICWNL